MTITGRATPGVVISVSQPAVADGKPTMPRYWSKFTASATLKQGSAHIHAIPNPDPVWDPRTGGWFYPPPPVSPPKKGPVVKTAGVGDYRWVVSTLPDPAHFTDGWYWLGDPSARDSTSGITSAARQWAPDVSTGGPSWHSFFPFKPSVSAVDAHVPGERSGIHHPRCVHMNSHYIEHMWLDFGKSVLQPFTWVVVCAVVSDPFSGYWHTVLDSGRNPDAVGFPRISASDCSTERQIRDHLGYRTRLAVTSGRAQMLTATTGRKLDARLVAGHDPQMLVGIFNGSKSTLGVYDPFEKRVSAGVVNSGTAYTHRYTVLGRENSWMSQRRACNLMVFEIRFWHRALLDTDLASQYSQLSTTYQFDRYRQL